MVSIGVPDKGRQLIAHLDLHRGDEDLFVDPENRLYDALDINRGIARTFLSPATSLSFLKRLIKTDGLKELRLVLSQWSKAVFIPPQNDQAFLQGATFVFDGAKTVHAHFDPGTAAHADPDDVMDIVCQVFDEQKAAVSMHTGR